MMLLWLLGFSTAVIGVFVMILQLVFDGNSQVLSVFISAFLSLLLCGGAFALISFFLFGGIL